jgi:L-alanine-DL-glutamate epimerase-like enolase superfamily enzyme
MAKRLTERVTQGFKFLKMDLNIAGLAGQGGVTRMPSASAAGLSAMPRTPHEFSGGQVTEKGLKAIEDYCAAIRERVGWTIPIATDHYGSFNVENIIKFAQTVDKFNFAWLEDTVPWMYADDLARIKNACKTPILTGEDIYLAENFHELLEKKAVSIVHPDPAECGGILEAKKIADLAAQYGVSTAFHNHNNPTTLFASAHAAAAAEQFVAVEFHNADHTDEFFSVVTGAPKPIVSEGFVTVPDGPGLGFEYDLEGLKKWVKEPGFFEPTKEWDNQRSFDGLFQ